jgi:protein-S-isoprenylcysteine O-methyltransferase Ste14
MHIIEAVIAVIWVGFWIYWLAAAGGVKAGRTPWGRLLAVRIVLVGIVIALVRSRALRSGTLNHDVWLGAAGLAVLLGGLALAVWARVYLGANWGMPMTEKVRPELVTSGPYHRVRHPIYSGLILGMVGTATAVSWYWLVAVAVLGGYFVYSAVMEERYMTGAFPDTYPDYRRGTKMLVPVLL